MYGLSNCVRCRCGEDLSMVSADQFGSYIEIPGGNVRVPLGYVGVLAPLLRDLPSCSLRYCKPVSCVRWGAVSDSCPRAVVKCCDGEEFPADYVIVSVPLGVLKHQHDKLFCPALPAEKTEAICKLGYGFVNKIFLEYARPFWVWREGDIRFAWSPDELSDRNDWLKGKPRRFPIYLFVSWKWPNSSIFSSNTKKNRNFMHRGIAGISARFMCLDMWTRSSRNGIMLGRRSCRIYNKITPSIHRRSDASLSLQSFTKQMVHGSTFCWLIQLHGDGQYCWSSMWPCQPITRFVPSIK